MTDSTSDLETDRLSGSGSVGGDSLLAAALEYAAEGLRVFLLGRSKRPMANCRQCQAAGPGHDREACGHLTCHGLYAATADPERIRAMRAASPDGLLAIRTGAVSGLVVVDIDPDHGGRIIPDLMPRTAYNATGSGGWHLLYKHPGVPVPCSQSRLGPGIDVRGDGGYFVAPPSIHPRTKRPYRRAGGHLIEMTSALVAACQPPTPATPAPMVPKAVSTRAVGGITSPAALLNKLLDVVAKAPEGKRRVTLYGAAHGAARMVQAGAITAAEAYEALYAAGIAAGQSDRDTRNAIKGGFADEGLAT